MGGESQAHRELKQIALRWARAQGYRIAAAEVSLPRYRFRLDVAVYRPSKQSITDPQSGRTVWQDSLGLCAVFECKASRADFQRDAASLSGTGEKLKALHARRLELERLLHLYYPSILQGDSLFQEYQSVDFSRAGHAEYEKTLKAIGSLSRQLLQSTKFEKLVRWSAANLFYVVASTEAIEPHEIPPGWGLLLRQGETLEPALKPIFHPIAEPERLALLHRIAITQTRIHSRRNSNSETP
jgi:hypothetical protein